MDGFRIPVGTWVDAGVDWLRDNLSGLFDVIAVGGPPYGRSARMPAFGGSLTPAEILREAGYSDGEITGLREAKAVFIP